MNKLLDLEILTKTFEDLPIGVGIFHVPDLNDIKSIRYVFMNNVLLYEMRKTSEEVLGKGIIEVAPEAFEHEGGLLVMETYRRIAEEGGSVNLGLVEYSNDMVAGTYECSVHQIKKHFVYVMLRNVTELEQTKNQLELMNEELSQFSYMVSHDLKEPLRTISSYTQMLKEDYKESLDEHGNKLIGFMLKATARMNQLIKDILDFSKTGQTKELSLVDCEKLIEDIKQDLATKIKDSKASIVVHKLPLLKGYETELRLLFQNLISNAIKFVAPGVSPEIIITAKEQDGWSFSIKDNGIGISEEHSQDVFNAFKRLHSNKEYEGTGIGLANCKKIVELHGGKLWLESKLEEGSTFHFNIPS